MKLTVRFYSHLTLIHQRTKSIRLDRVQKLQRKRGRMRMREHTHGKAKPEAEECSCGLKEARIPP